MTWTKEYFYVPQYKWTGCNQYGDRFKKTGIKTISIACLSCNFSDKDDLRTLILLSHQLDAPVRYDFDSKPQRAFIRIVSQEKLQEVV